MFGYFYNSTLKKYIISVGYVFNAITIKRKTNTSVKDIKVPITNTSKEKFFKYINTYNNLESNENVAKVETILPRMNLTLIDMEYDVTHKTNGIFFDKINIDSDDARSNTVLQFNVVPYRMTFELGIYTRYIDDMYQIIEQILPYFQPHLTYKVAELYEKNLKIDRDITLNLLTVSPDEDSGEDLNRRRLEWSITFAMTGYFYPPQQKNVLGEIKTIYIDIHGNKKTLGVEDSPYESVDLQLDPIDVHESNWDGSYKESYSHGVEIPKKTPSKMRENKND